MDNLFEFVQIGEDIDALKVQRDALKQQLKGYHNCIRSRLTNKFMMGNAIVKLVKDFEEQGAKLEYNRNKLGQTFAQIDDVIKAYGHMNHTDMTQLEQLIDELHKENPGNSSVEIVTPLELM
ncbi:Hypothetical_protein [Hexamita inflata]|uniref:Hypothetical_protein n=1 Tax=Hexamita inflata TaxID=28002 RepID=A0AA86PF68_9EUKA|nr:Hypothetical protein HINF_LOCUS25002 [Hexamita inflata]